ncbi:MAG: hypothetical protein ILA11_10950 [Butyrivibrio sp.]|nr:hypothetical protein [Butyrivibrio sp.]
MAEYVNNELNIVRVGDPIGYITNKVLTSDGFSFRVTNETGTGLDAISKTYRDLCGTTPYDINSYYPGYSFNLFDSNIPAKPFTAYAPVPRIYDVKVYNDKVVKVFFNDRTTETAVCQEGDKFDLDMGITVCIMKKMLGRNEYFRMLKKAKKNAAAHRELEKKSAEAVEIRKRQRAKEEARKKARRERKNKELATAIAEAMTAKKKK